MASNRLIRVNQLLQREIAIGIYKVINVEGFDMSTVTITHVFTSPDLRHARVLVSIRGKDEEVRKHLNLLKKIRVDLQREVFSKVTLKYSPRFRFELDNSLSEGDRILTILQKLDEEEPLPGNDAKDVAGQRGEEGADE
jgi:ribosome-binding factor A